MKIIITAKTGKGEKSTEKDIDKTVNEIIKIVTVLEKMGYKPKSCKCYCDGTSVVWEKK